MNNISITVTQQEAAMIVDSLDHSLPVWADAVRDNNTRMLAAMLNGDEAIVFECLAEIRAAVDRWESQRELIVAFKKHIDTGSSDCNNNCCKSQYPGVRVTSQTDETDDL